MLFDQSLLLLTNVNKMEKGNFPISSETYEDLIKTLDKTLEYIKFSNNETDLGMSIFIQNRLDEYNKKYYDKFKSMDSSYKIFNFDIPSWAIKSFSKLSSWLDF